MMVPCPPAGAVVAGVLTFYSLIVRGSADGFLTTGQLIENHGHQSYSKHSVITEDGYIINLFHIKGQDGPPFLLLHALMAASDQWFIRDGDHDLPSVLSNSGYDVWMGDFRGNIYSKKHTHLNVSDPEYWNFSIDEWAYYDVPAMMDYVCNNTEYDKMYVVTYSLSSTILLATASARPEYNDKIIVSYHIMAPFLAFSKIKSLLLRIAIQFGEFYLEISRNIKNYELFSRNQLALNSISLFCNKKSIFLKACVTVLSELFGFESSGNFTMDLDFKLTYSRAGVSLYSLDHLLQMIKSNKVQHYDLGHNKNLQKYGQPKPPEYDLRKVTSPVVLYYSKNDRAVDSGYTYLTNIAIVAICLVKASALLSCSWIGIGWYSRKTIQKLISVLPNVYQSITIPDNKFGHIDYAFNSNAKTLVFDSIINIARQFRVAPIHQQYGYS